MKVEEEEKEVRQSIQRRLFLLGTSSSPRPWVNNKGCSDGVLGPGLSWVLSPVSKREKWGMDADYPKPISGLGNKNRERGKKRRAWPWKSFFKTSVCNSRRKKKQR